MEIYSVAVNDIMHSGLCALISVKCQSRYKWKVGQKARNVRRNLFFESDTNYWFEGRG